MTPKTPSLTASPSELTLSTGSKVTLTCATSSHGSVSYKFLLNVKDIPHASGSSNTYTVPSKVTTSINSYTCKVTISGAESLPSTDHKVEFVGEFILSMILEYVMLIFRTFKQFAMTCYAL